MEIECPDESASYASSSIASSSRRSSASSQLDSERSECSSGKTRSALTNAYGALRRFVTRKASNKRTDSPHLPADNLTGLVPERTASVKHSPVEKVANKDLDDVAQTSHASATDEHNQKRKKNERDQRRASVGSATKSTNRGKATKTAKDMPRPAPARPDPVKKRAGVTGPEAYAEALEDAARSGSEGEILAGRGIIINRKLGEGTYAKVRSAFHTRLQRPSYVAVKIISRDKTNERYQRKFLPRELSVLRQIRHKNLIRLIDCFEHGAKVFMVMELANYGDLLEYIQRKRVLPNDRARFIFTQILDGVEYLHLKGMFHRDLKCENILLNVGYKVKITDFGFAREWSEAHNLCRTFCGSAAYASPEILRGIPYDPNVADIWSMGVILFIMVTGTMPYDDSDVKKMLDIMSHNRLDFPRKRPVCYEVKVLLHSILYYYYRDRATLAKIRNSPWMHGQSTMPSTDAPSSSSTTSTTHAESAERETQTPVPRCQTQSNPSSSGQQPQADG